MTGLEKDGTQTFYYLTNTINTSKNSGIDTDSEKLSATDQEILSLFDKYEELNHRMIVDSVESINAYSSAQAAMDRLVDRDLVVKYKKKNANYYRLKTSDNK